jgi:DNA-binding transcriptional LysR family regulator
LDQLRIFLAVVEAGSFAAAARRLGRVTSVVSYGIANLEAQLGLALFDRRATRRPQLTEAGRAILADSRAVALGVDGLVAKARGLVGGLEAEVSLVVDVMLPTPVLASVLEAFRDAFPTVTLRLSVEALGAVAQLVLDGAADIGISGPLLWRLEMLEQRLVGRVALIPVAAPSHALARKIGPIAVADARAEVQLVLSDRSRLTEGLDLGVVALNTWRLADLGAKHALLLAGVGWGSMPEPMVCDDLAAGRLVRLALDHWSAGLYALQAIHRADTPPGPAARWLTDRFKDAMG